MRLHRLEVTAFGPFADTVTVDFDDLGATGLFLLTGPTGAGKSSVLDAVCFALYGEVPGDRQQARHLRSDHAPEDRAPEVVLTTSIAGRTFRFTRSPAWERPKRRGTGTTRQQPRVLVEEHRDGTWTGLATRLDDAGLLVGSLLGMTCAQFTQVAMLPQGRFQALLRASSAERHQVLQRLFRTDRFEHVEQWLTEHRTATRRRSEALGLRVAAQVHRLQEAGAVAAPAEWDLDDLALPAARGEVAAWAGSVAGAAREACDDARGQHAATASAAAIAEDELSSARTTAALLDEARAATETLQALERDAPAAEQASRVLASHERALAVEPAARAVATADAAVDDAWREVARAGRAAGLATQLSRPAGADPDETAAALEELSATLSGTIAEAEARHARLRAALPRFTERAGLLADLDPLEHDLDADRVALERARAVATDLPGRVRQVETDQRAAAAAATDAAAAQDALNRTDAGVAAAREVLRTVGLVEEGRITLLDATEETHRLREAYLDAREARIASIASELAVGLVSGCSCPVCGSVDHPTPARSHGPATREVEETARRAYEDAETARMAQHEAQAARVARLAALREASDGRDVAAWETDEQAARDRLAVARAAGEQADALEQQRQELSAQLEETTAATAVLEVSVARGEERLAHLRSTVQSLTEELADLAVPGEEDDLEPVADAARRQVSALHVTRRALERLSLVREAARAARDHAGQACAEAGFTDAAAALAALLEPEDARSRAAALAERAARAEAARRVLQRSDVVSALSAEPPDLRAVSARSQEACVARDAAAAILLDRERSAERTTVLCQDTVTALAAWTPVREAAALAASLAAFVEGKGPDNPLRMRLSAYVLAERLRQVVAAANERLAAMSGQRYALEQADERGAGDRRGGLSLRIRDEWSGAVRDPVTLSGGETFVVSLALALGLADTVSHEAGGTDIDTLFIDEGFGSLDADTLDEVMDTLDGLREGGRTVGLVSHVPELRARITARLEVRKARAGSTLVLA